MRCRSLVFLFQWLLLLISVLALVVVLMLVCKDDGSVEPAQGLQVDTGPHIVNHALHSEAATSTLEPARAAGNHVLFHNILVEIWVRIRRMIRRRVPHHVASRSRGIPVGESVMSPAVADEAHTYIAEQELRAT